MTEVDEILDLVNEKDEVIGSTHRKGVHERKDKHRAVQVFIFNSENKMLVEKRSMSKSAFPGQYCAGVAGHVSQGESYDDAAARETEEETGIKDLKLNFVCKIQFCPETLYEFLQVYEAGYDGEITFDPTETQSMHWFSIEEIMNLAKRKDVVASVFLKCLEGYLKAKGVKEWQKPEI